MTIDIKTLKVEPRRHTFGHIARRLGADKPASRYEEGTLDLQATDNFHYKPLWGADYWHFDERRTAIRMADWYALRDPRQYYYASYNITRANQYQVTEHNFDFVEKRNLLALLDPGWRKTIAFYLLPLRHAEWGANMNCTDICDRGYGTAITAASMFSAGDHLAMAQIIGRIGLLLDGNSGAALEQAKTDWMEAGEWQDIRRMTEDSLVIGDWFELFVAQNLCVDGLLYPLVYAHFDSAGQDRNAAGLSMLTEFMSEWFAEHSRWVDALLKTAVAESAGNKALIDHWFAIWSRRAATACAPLVAKVLGAEAGSAAIGQTLAELDKRAAGLGITV